MKQTIPMGWEEKTITDIANVTTGKWDANHSKTDGLYKFFTCASKPMLCDTYRYDGECLILPGNGANVGDVYYFNGKFDAYQRTYVISDVKYLSVKYLYYFLLCYWRDKNLDKQYGAATNYIKIGNFQDFVVLFPTKIEEQRHIVEKLDTLFADIDSEKQIVQQNLQNAKDLFESKLHKLFTENTDAWTETTLKNVLSRGSSNLSANKLIDCDGDYPVYGASGLVKNVNFYQQETDYLAIIKDGAGVGRVYHYGAHSSVLGTLQYLFPKPDINIRFAYYFLTSIDYKKYYQGAAIPHIYYKDYCNEKIVLPPLPEQRRIVENLDALQEQTQELEQIYTQQIADLDELKQAILKKAFNGEL